MRKDHTALFTPYNANQVTRTFSSTCSRHLSCAQRPDAVTTGTLSRGVYQSAVVYCSIKNTTTPNNCIHLDTFLRIFLVPVFSCGQVQSGRKQGGREAEVQQGGRRRAAGRRHAVAAPSITNKHNSNQTMMHAKISICTSCLQSEACLHPLWI